MFSSFFFEVALKEMRRGEKLRREWGAGATERERERAKEPSSALERGGGRGRGVFPFRPRRRLPRSSQIEKTKPHFAASTAPLGGLQLVQKQGKGAFLSLGIIGDKVRGNCAGEKGPKDGQKKNETNKPWPRILRFKCLPLFFSPRVPSLLGRFPLSPVRLRKVSED